jgi:hypothetical protein
MTTGAAARSHVLQTAERLVNNERNTQYDEPSADFARTAGMWTAYLGIPVAMHDVAMCMAMLKIARIRFAPGHLDNYFDLAGYAACGADVADAVQLEEMPLHDDCVLCPTTDAQGNRTNGFLWQEQPECAL